MVDKQDREPRKPFEPDPTAKPHDPDKPYYHRDNALGPRQIFKLTRPAFVVGNSNTQVEVISEDGKWRCQMPMSQTWWSFFGDKTVIYVDATPDRNIGLHIHKFGLHDKEF